MPDLYDMWAERDCGRCGSPFSKTPGPGRWPKECPSCRLAPRPKPPPRPYPATRKLAPKVVVTAECEGCGTKFSRERAPGGPPTRFCSESCRTMMYRIEAGRWSRLLAEQSECPYCNEAFTPTRPEQRYCCRSHGWLYRSQAKPKNSDWLAGRKSVRTLPCMSCGTPVATRGTAVMCSPCKAEATKANNRRKNAKRRGATVGRSFTLKEIGARDGWNCHLCHKSVDGRLPGTVQMGPTIDHLIPIAAGGADVPENVALAHRQCNSTRGAKGLAQLRLIA